MKTKKFNLGVITLSNKVMVSDPCYGLLVWCNKTIENVLSGNYNCFTRVGKDGVWGERVKELTICHVDRKPFTAFKHLDYIGSVGVDSGTCGIYDNSYYESTHDEKHAEEKWYDKNVCSDFHLEKSQGLILENKGIISCSGYGDGMYGVYVKRNENGLIHQITLKYI